MTAWPSPALRQAVPSRLARAQEVLAFEWAKLRSVRSSRWMLLVAAAVTLGVSHPGVPGAVLAAGCALAACALVGLGLGAIIRHTAGAIAAAVAVIYLLGVFGLILPSPWGTRLGRFTMPFAAYQAVASHPLAGLLSPGLSMLVIIAWPAATLAAAAIVISRRDV